MKMPVFRRETARPGAALLGLVFLIVYASQTHLGSDIIGVLRDSRMAVIYWRTLGIALGASVAATFGGLALGYFLTETALPLAGLFKTVFYWPLILPPYFLTAAWLSWLGDFGLLKRMGLRLAGPGGCIFLMALYLTPLVVVAVVNAASSQPGEGKEAALLMGNQGRYFLRIWLPRVMPAALGGAFLVFALALNNYSIPSILAVNTLSTEVYTEFGAFYDPYRALVKSLPFFVLLMVLFLASRKNLTAAFADLGTGRPGIRDGRPAIRTTGAVLWPAYVLAALVIPVIGLILQTKSPGPMWKAISLARSQIAFSLWFNALAAAFIAVPGAVLAYCHSRGRAKGAMTLLAALFVVPPVLAAVGLIFLLNRPGLGLLYQTGFLLYLGYAVRFVPLAFFLLLPAVNVIPRELEEASLLTGSSPAQSRRRILWPLVLPAGLMVWLLSFFLCSGEADCAILLYPPGAETIAMRVLSLLHYGTGPIVNGLVLSQLALLAGAGLLCRAAYGMLLKKRGGGSSGNAQ